MISNIFWTNEYSNKNSEFDFSSYVNKKLEKFNIFSLKIAKAIPIIRKILENDIKILNKKESYFDLVGIDGSNTQPQKDPFITSFSVNAIVYLQFESKRSPARFLKAYDMIDIPTPNFSNIYMHLRRDILEMRVYLELTDAVEPDIIFMDRSINSQGIWNARIKQLQYDLYIIPKSINELYNLIFKNSEGLWPKVMERLKDFRTIWIPKRIVGKSFINSLKRENHDLDIPDGITNEIFSFILKPNEFLGPFPFEKWVQRSTAEVRNFVREIYTVYYKPPYNEASAVKLEFHKNFLPDLETILRTIKNQYSIYNKQINPILWAHTLAKNENLDVGGLNATIQRLAILKCINPTLKKIIQSYFSNFNY